MKKMFLAICVVAMAAFSGSAKADIVVDYIPADGTTGFSLPTNSVADGVSATPITAAAGLNDATGSTFNFSGWDTASTDFDAAVAANDFWSWSFTVDSGTVELTTMDIRLDRSGSGPDDFEIRASVNGGTASTLLTHDYGDSSSGVNFNDVDISALGVLGAGDSVSFTLAAFNSESSGGTFDLEGFGAADVPGLIINGNITAIPEPGTALALCLAIGGIAAVRRRK